MNKETLTILAVVAIGAGVVWYLSKKTTGTVASAPTAPNPAAKNALTSVETTAATTAATDLTSWLTDEFSNTDSTNSTTQD